MRRILLLLIAGVAVVACGDDDDDATPATDDPAVTSESDAAGEADDTGDSGDSGCDLVAVDEVEDITGATVGEATALPQGCQWILADEPAGALYDWQSIPVEAFDTNRDAAGSISSMSAEPIDELGVEAYLRASLDPDGNPLTAETWVLVSDESAFFVRSTLPSSEEVIAAQADLAQLIVDRTG